MISVAKDLITSIEASAEKTCDREKGKQCPHCIAVKELKRLADEARISIRNIGRHSGK